MKKLQYLILFFLITHPLIAKNILDVSHKYIHFYKPSEYKSDAQVWDMTRGKGDDMYFATNEGVVLYDGVRWEKYATPDECIMRSVLYDSDDDIIYSGGVNEIGYWKYDAFGNLQYQFLFQNPKGEPTKEFWKITKVPYSSLIYFQAPNSLLVYHTKEHTFKEIPNEGKRYNALSLINQKIYVQQEEMLWQIDEYKKIPVTDKLKNFYIIGMFPEANGNIRLVTPERGVLLLNSEGTIEPEIWGVKDIRITSMNQMGDNYLVGTGNSGFYILDKNGNILSQIDESQGLKNAVLSVEFDNKGDIWLGLNGGIIHVAESVKEESYLMDSQEIIGYVYCVLNSSDKLYLGTNRGLFTVDQKSEVTPRFDLLPSLKGQVWNLYKLGNYVVVAHNKGLFTICDNQMKEVKHGGVYNLSAIPIHPQWYISGNYNGLSLYTLSEEGLTFRHNIEGYSNLVQDCAFDKEGNLWIVHSKTEFLRLRFDDEYKRIIESEIYECASSESTRLSLCLVDQELLLLDNNEHVYKYNELENVLVPDEYYTSLLKPINKNALAVQYNNGLFWQINNEGIAFLKKEYNKLSLFSQLFSNMSDFFIPRSFRRVFQLDEKLYAVGFLNGIGLLEVDKMDSPFIRTPQIRKIEAIGRDGNQWLTVIDNKWDIPAQYTSVILYFTELERNSVIEYKVKGKADQWSVSNDGSISLTYLTPGDYSLEICGSNGYGVNSEVNTIYLHVRAPWYMTPYAYLAYMFIFIIVVYGVRRIYKWKTHRHEIRIKKEEEQKRKEELAQFQLHCLKEELENKDSKLMSITMLGVQNNTFLKKTKEDVSVLLTDGILPAHKIQIKRIIKEIDHQLNDQSGWDNFAEHFNNTCNGFFDKLNELHPKLTNNDLRLCAYIRMNLSAKEIATLMNISITSVEMAKYRLRKKLNLDETITLNQYLNDMISNLDTLGNFSF